MLWPKGFGGAFDWLSALIGITAFSALWRYRIGIIAVISICGAVGLACALARPLPA